MGRSCRGPLWQPQLASSPLSPSWATLPLTLQYSLWLCFTSSSHFQVGYSTGFAQGLPSTRVSKTPPKKVILPLEMSLTDTEMEIIVFSLQHSKLQISDCVKQPPASHSKLQISDCAKQLPVSMCTFLNAASTWLCQEDEASNWELFI